MTGAGTSGTEERLRDALDALAAEVRPQPGAYRRARAGWRRRERKRRLILAILAALVFAIADVVGLWALNQADVNTHIIFSDPTSGQDRPIVEIGQP